MESLKYIFAVWAAVLGGVAVYFLFPTPPTDWEIVGRVDWKGEVWIPMTSTASGREVEIPLDEAMNEQRSGRYTLSKYVTIPLKGPYGEETRVPTQLLSTHLDNGYKYDDREAILPWFTKPQRPKSTVASYIASTPGFWKKARLAFLLIVPLLAFFATIGIFEEQDAEGNPRRL